MPADAHINDDLARHNVWVLTIAHAVLGSQLPMMFTIAGLVGQMLAPVPCLATAGISVMFLSSMITAPFLSSFMQTYGRRAGFAAGAIAGLFGALVSAYGIFEGSFGIFLAGAFISGFYHPSQQALRFAATDNASDDFRPRAISYVLAGGLAAAIIGPQVVKVTYQAGGMIYIGTYLAIAAVNVIGIWIFLFLKPTGLVRGRNEPKPEARGYRDILTNPGIVVAIICAIVSYSLMTLMMTSAPLAIVGCGFAPSIAADVVMAHVLAMYVPSFFTGHLINRFGHKVIVGTGLAILCASGIVAIAGTDLTNFFGALILLGIGWNFGFIGATSMLANAHTPEERGRVQGLNDFLLIGSMMFASLASGGLMNCVGTSPVAGWNAVTLAMMPTLALAFGALVWFSMRSDR